MSIATLFHNPSVEELNARAAIIAAGASLIVTVVWLVVARLMKKKGARMKLSSLFWIIAGSSVALLALGIVGFMTLQTGYEEENQMWERKFRQRDVQPEKTP